MKVRMVLNKWVQPLGASLITKGGFFQKARCVFQISKSPKTKYSKSLSWTWNISFPPITVNNKFKFQAQDSNSEYFSFWNWEIWKRNYPFWKNVTFSIPHGSVMTFLKHFYSLLTFTDLYLGQPPFSWLQHQVFLLEDNLSFLQWKPKVDPKSSWLLNTTIAYLILQN